MITALPEGLRGAVEKAAEVAGVNKAETRDAILAFLNAALDAGVAREIPDDQALIAYAVFDDKFPALIIRTGPEMTPSKEEHMDGNRPLPIDRETLGRMVREAWVRWAQTRPNPKPSWLVPYDELSEPDKEADRQIGEAVARWTLIHDAARHSARRNT